MNLAEMFERPEWSDRAACRGIVETHGSTHRDRLFFPSRGMPTKPGKQMCARCPVRDECLEYALSRPEIMCQGTWGGTSQHERRQIREQRLAAAS